MSVIGLIILAVIVLALLGGFRNWGGSPFYGMGHYGGYGLGTVLIVVLILVILGKI